MSVCVIKDQSHHPPPHITYGSFGFIGGIFYRGISQNQYSLSDHLIYGQNANLNLATFVYNFRVVLDFREPNEPWFKNHKKLI